MSKSYDIFLSHSGAQKEFVEQLFTELTRQYGQYSVFFDKNSIKHGEPISSIIVEYAKTCKLAVAVLSEEYLTRSKPPMLELAASYTASKYGNGIPCLLPVFLELKPQHAKSFKRQLKWKRTWDEWRRNEIMSDRPKPKTNRVEPTVWREALVKLLDTRGPVYKPHENRYKSALFAKNVARVIACKLDELLSKTKGKAKESVLQYKATDLGAPVDMPEHSSIWSRRNFDQIEEFPYSPQFNDRTERASTSGETRLEATDLSAPVAMPEHSSIWNSSIWSGDSDQMEEFPYSPFYGRRERASTSGSETRSEATHISTPVDMPEHSSIWHSSVWSGDSDQMEEPPLNSPQFYDRMERASWSTSGSVTHLEEKDLSAPVDMPKPLSICSGDFDQMERFLLSPRREHNDRRERASTSGETRSEIECSSCWKYAARESLVEVREREVEVREKCVDERERNLEADLEELRIRRDREDQTVLPAWLVDHYKKTGKYQKFAPGG